MRKYIKMLKLLLLHWVLLLEMSQEKHSENKNTLRTSQGTRILFTRERKREKQGAYSFFSLRETKISDVGKTRFRVVLSNILEACRKD